MRRVRVQRSLVWGRMRAQDSDWDRRLVALMQMGDSGPSKDRRLATPGICASHFLTKGYALIGDCDNGCALEWDTVRIIHTVPSRLWMPMRLPRSPTVRHRHSDQPLRAETPSDALAHFLRTCFPRYRRARGAGTE